MLTEHKQLKLSVYMDLYDKIIPKNHILRKIKATIDFSFVNPMLEKSYCKYYGRPAKEPEMMFKLLFLKMLYDLSDDELIQNAEVNMAYKFFLDLNPEDEIINSSLLAKFRRSRINNEEILEEMLSESVRQAIEKGVIKSNTLIVDATHTKSKSNVETPMQILRKASKNLRKEVYKGRYEISEKFPPKLGDTATLDEEISYTKELLETIRNDVIDSDTNILNEVEKVQFLLEDDRIKELQSGVDTDAKVGHKSRENSFLGYKSHVAMTDERVITAIEVSTGEAADGNFLETLIEKSQKKGIEVKEVIGDTAYSGKNNLEYMGKENISAITPIHPIISNGGSNTRQGFEYIKDADMIRCPGGHLSIRKAKTGKKRETNCNQQLTYYFDIEKCKQCKYKDGCYKDGAKNKTYSTRILSETHQKAIKHEETENFSLRKKERYKIEAKNSEMKQSHGLGKCKYMGLFGMKIQSYMTAFVVNTKRIVRVLEAVSV